MHRIKRITNSAKKGVRSHKGTGLKLLVVSEQWNKIDLLNTWQIQRSASLAKQPRSQGSLFSLEKEFRLRLVTWLPKAGRHIRTIRKGLQAKFSTSCRRFRRFRRFRGRAANLKAHCQRGRLFLFWDKWPAVILSTLLPGFLAKRESSRVASALCVSSSEKWLHNSPVKSVNKYYFSWNWVSPLTFQI